MISIERAKEILGLGTDAEPTTAWLLGREEVLWHRKNKKSFDDKCRESHAIHALLMRDEDYCREMEAAEAAYREETERLRMFEHNDGRPLSNVELEVLFACEYAAEFEDEEV